ncbi:MAG TPA: right-handed parallel beta-helix repeat-containing protein [Streptosporangiaceae bacterium]|nr:right-handed parallel beta-helix repeat-containing protein [Streptosporangiaceae bacterium]
MTATRTAAARTAAAPAPRGLASHPGRRSRRAAAALGVAALAAAGVLAGGSASRAAAAVLTNCAANPASCGYPGTANTGVPAGTTLKSVPSQVSSGPGWAYNATDNNVTVTGNGTVLTGLSLPCTLVIDASNVTVNDVQVITSGAFGITLTHTKGVTIENSVISGTNATTGRVDSAIDDVYGDSTGMVIKDNNISLFRTAMQISAGLVEGNYIHDPGYIAGDHTNGIVTNGGTEPMTIEDNTIFNSLGQTDAISLDAATAGATVSNKTIENNFLAGGGYSIYGGDGQNNPTSNIIITGNRFGQQYYAKGGQFGAVAYYNPAGTGNTWTANIWDTTAQTITAPAAA